MDYTKYFPTKQSLSANLHNSRIPFSARHFSIKKENYSVKFWIIPSYFPKKVRIISKFGTHHQKTFFIHTVFLQYSRQNHRRTERAYAAYRPLSHCSLPDCKKSGPAPQNVQDRLFRRRESPAGVFSSAFGKQARRTECRDPAARPPGHRRRGRQSSSCACPGRNRG